MRYSFHLAVITALAFIACSSLALAKKKAPSSSSTNPKFYFELRDVEIPRGAKPELKNLAKKLLQAELQNTPQIASDLGDPPPQGEALERVLHERKLQGYGIVLRITQHKQSIEPPPEGKVYKVSMVEVSLAIHAEKLPHGQLALAGEGMAQVGTEITRVNEKEQQQLLREALADAIHQAMSKSVNKLAAPAHNPTKKSRKKSKKH
jgi:hypothetical protein